MSGRKKTQKVQEEKWEDIPYGDYLNTVDNLLESRYGRTSTQRELAYIAECQEALCSPEECADSIINDDWIVSNRN